MRAVPECLRDVSCIGAVQIDFTFNFSLCICFQICVADEKVVFEICMSWYEHSLDDRQGDLYNVMKCVRFANIDPYYFQDRVHRSAVLLESPELSRLFEKVCSYYMLPNRRDQVLTFNQSISQNFKWPK